MSNSISGADSSASSWAEATIGAAEAYAQEQADAAAAERNIAEQRAAALAQSGQDVVERPPTPAERAQGAFWENDPNRPTSPPPGGTTAPTGFPSVGQSVSRDQAAALIAANENVTRDEHGNYTWYPPPADIKTTEQAPLEAPSSILPIPSYSGNTTTAPTPAQSPTENPPGGVPEVTDAGAVEGTKPIEEPPIKTGLGEEVDKIVNKSPTLRKQWAELQKNEWGVRWAEAGEWSNVDHTNRKIILDPSLKGFPEKLAQVFSHELGHVLNPPVVPSPDGLTKEEYSRQRVNGLLDSEGGAAFENTRAHMEAREKGGNLQIAGKQDPRYLEIYTAFQNEKISEAEAKHQMGQVFGDQERHAGTGKPYREHFNEHAEKEWADAQPPK